MIRTPAFWYLPRRTLPALLLSPLGALYGLASSLAVAWRGFAPYIPTVPVVSIGNLVAGGTGKTPLASLLATHLATPQRPVAIVSRGYGGTLAQPTLVDAQKHTAAQVGDEPLMLARRLSSQNVQVWVGRNRKAAVQAAEAAGAALVVLDDGFQRRDIYRAANILVMHGENGFGNGLCIPAGPLREPMSAVARADLIVVMNAPAKGHRPHAPVFALAYGLDTQALHALAPKPVVAFAAVGHPERFFAGLTGAGLDVVATVPFPDHAAFTAADLDNLSGLAKTHRATLVCTDKDAVKLPRDFPATPIREHLSGDTAALLAAVKKRLNL